MSHDLRVRPGRLGKSADTAVVSLDAVEDRS